MQIMHSAGLTVDLVLVVSAVVGVVCEWAWSVNCEGTWRERMGRREGARGE